MTGTGLRRARAESGPNFWHTPVLDQLCPTSLHRPSPHLSLGGGSITLQKRSHTHSNSHSPFLNPRSIGQTPAIAQYTTGIKNLGKPGQNGWLEGAACFSGDLAMACANVGAQPGEQVASSICSFVACMYTLVQHQAAADALTASSSERDQAWQYLVSFPLSLMMISVARSVQLTQSAIVCCPPEPPIRRCAWPASVTTTHSPEICSTRAHICHNTTQLH